MDLGDSAMLKRVVWFFSKKRAIIDLAQFNMILLLVGIMISSISGMVAYALWGPWKVLATLAAHIH